MADAPDARDAPTAADRAKVRGLLLRLVRDEALAEDLVQEALLRASRTSHAHRGASSFSTWLAAIALNLARDHFRARKRQPPWTGLEDAAELAAPDRPEGEVLQAEMSTCILSHVHRLPQRQRDAVLMHHFAGLSHREQAAAQGISEGNARVVLHRGLAALRQSLARECVLDFADEIPCERKTP